MYFFKQIIIKTKYVIVLMLTMAYGSTVSASSFTKRTARDSSATVEHYLGKDFQQVAGIFPIYFKADRSYLFIADSLLGRDILQTVSLLKGSARVIGDQKDRYGYGGDVVFEQTFRFTRISKTHIGMVQPLFFATKDSSVVGNNYLSPSIAQAFEVKCQTVAGSLIEITGLINGDSELFSLKGATTALRLGAYLRDRSYPTETLGNSHRMLFRSIRSYGPSNAAKPGSAANSKPAGETDQAPVETIWEIGSCWYLLPKTPMRRRYDDSRVGFFTGDFADFDNAKSALNHRKLVRKWNMLPKEQDRDAYLAGKLVEPRNPIVFYVDKNFPEAMVPYIIEGVNAWQKSFEKAGFKNAIYAIREQDFAGGKEFPWDDVQYSAISFKGVTTPNAYGPMVIDPRSGEIISAHVALFHNIFDVLQRWYFALCAPLDDRALQLPFDSALMGPLIRNVITHEVGHSLGLRHNFAASTQYPSDSLRNQEFVQRHGIGLSIMDYLRFNQVVQPEDNMPAKLLLNALGPYDDFAIKWGYKYWGPHVGAELEADTLNNWVNQQLKLNPRLRYVEENVKGDPTVQQEDIGQDVVRSSELAIANLKRTMILIANLKDQENYLYTRQMYMTVLNKYQLFVGHVASFIGGKYTGINRKDHTAPVLVTIPVREQEEALQFIKTYFIKPQEWLYPMEIQNRSRFYLSVQVSPWIREFISILLVKPTLLVRNLNVSPDESLEIDHYLKFLTTAFFDPETMEDPLSTYTQMLQNEYVNRMIALAANIANTSGDTSLHMTANLKSIRSYAQQAQDRSTTLAGKTHYTGIIKIIDSWMGI